MRQSARSVCLSLGLVLLLAGRGFTQDIQPRHEVSLGFGFLTAQEYVWLVGDIVGTMFTGREADDISGTGNISLSYRYHINRTFAFGLSATVENIDVTYKDGGETDRYKTLAVMGTVRLKYLDRPRISLYSGAGLGFARFAFEDSVGSGLAFQLALFGLGWRLSKNLGLHFELGAGYQGLFHIGLFGRF